MGKRLIGSSLVALDMILFWLTLGLRAELKAKRRNELPDSDFAIPSQRKYPIHNRAHGANALSRARAEGPSVYSTVHAAVCKRYPDLPACNGQGTGR